MTRVTATQAESEDQGADDWRPTPLVSHEDKFRAEFLADEKPGKATHGKPANDEESEDEDEDLDDDLDGDDDQDDDEDGVVDGEEDEEEEKPASRSKSKGRPPVDPEDDEDEDDEAADPDDDSDLDEEDDAKPDPVEARGLAKLQKQEQRMRQQIEREREVSRGEIAREREAIKVEREQAAAATTRLERLASRVKIDPLGVLEELGLDDAEYVGKQAFARVQAATDPKFREAARAMQRDRERDAELAEVKRKLEERDKAETETKQQAEQRQRLHAVLDADAAAARKVPKATLTQLALKNDPEHARSLLAQARLAIWQRDGVEPTDPRVVVLAAEKLQRQELRRYGIDPRTLAKRADADEDADSGKPAIRNGKAANGKGKKPPAQAQDDELVMPTREQVLSEDWTPPRRVR